MSMPRKIAVVAAALLLGGCMRVTLLGHTVTEGRASAPRQTQQDADAQALARASRAVTAVSVALIPEIGAPAIAGARIEAAALRAAIEAAWRERGMLDEQVSSHTADVQIIEAKLQRTGTTVVFGRIPATGSLTGMVRIRDAGGQELRVFRVVVETAVDIPEEGAGAEALAGLYRRFADNAAIELAASGREPR